MALVCIIELFAHKGSPRVNQSMHDQKSRLCLVCLQKRPTEVGFSQKNTINRSDPVLDLFDMLQFLPKNEKETGKARSFFQRTISSPREIIQSSKHAQRKKYHVV